MYFPTHRGVNTYSRALAAFLVPLEGEPLVSHLRIVDKYSVAPATTYLGAEFPKVLAKPEVNYKQANLTDPSIVQSIFNPPEGKGPYDYVFDLTGEVRHDRTEMILINTTCNVARMLGQEAAKRKVKAYVRVTLPFYETTSKGTHDEKSDPKPDETIGTWWHETLRMLAAIEECVNPTNTLHVEDLAGAAWASAMWMASLGRKEADSLAGESIIFHNEKSKVSQVEGMPPHDTHSSIFTLLSVGQTHHVGGWTQMIKNSKPPIPNTPLSAYMDKYALETHIVALSNTEIKEVIGYKLKRPQFNHNGIKDIVDEYEWKEEGNWPIL
ncbi:hypothetical protein GGU10DRAFT_416606 [Lentinula aff. detonsa]|uniref:Uncharacterized protein n=1 Tax=Lentinula aff. detonsa TaxID=2804958 RepID=A0AA38KWI0_9AGAR|nr:hypothetical protein GGU10DRAFT_416606 [Lentinula aff. detonsa]